MTKSLICFNVHYAPSSFGGATIVAEEVNRVLVEQFDWEVTVITTERNDKLFPYHIRKFRAKGVDVYSINLPRNLSPDESYANQRIDAILNSILQSSSFDYAHLHAIQNMGIGMVRVLNSYDIPTIITLHDCWWLCQRQFMINKHGKYCFQSPIEDTVCMHCVDDPVEMFTRKSSLLASLKLADKLLFPSQFHRDFHVANGFSEEQCLVNKNGIRFPKDGYQKSTSSKVRFGYVGGPGHIKGAELIRSVFGKLDLGNWELKLVDAGANVGAPWENEFKSWNLGNNVKIIPGYTQQTMDQFFSSIDVLLFPSQWKESFGLTVREALVRDVWVISTDGGGTVEDIVDGENGTIIKLSGDPQYLSSAVSLALKKDWKRYSNTHKAKIKNYSEQALEVKDILEKLDN